MGWYTITTPSKADKYTGVRHTRTGAANMREHRKLKQDAAYARNAITPDPRRAAYRRVVMASATFGVELAEMKRQMRSSAADMSKRGMRKRRAVKAETMAREYTEAAKQLRDLAHAAGQTFTVVDGQVVVDSLTGIQEALVGEIVDVYGIHRTIERFNMEHKLSPGIPEQMTARQMDLYDNLGDL